MKLADFLKKIEGLDPNTVLCVAEVDEAFGSEVADVESQQRAAAKPRCGRSGERRIGEWNRDDDRGALVEALGVSAWGHLSP
jgi:hypothetical protein